MAHASVEKSEKATVRFQQEDVREILLAKAKLIAEYASDKEFEEVRMRILGKQGKVKIDVEIDFIDAIEVYLINPKREKDFVQREPQRDQKAE